MFVRACEQLSIASYASAVLAIEISVCLSVCSSHAAIVRQNWQRDIPALTFVISMLDSVLINYSILKYDIKSLNKTIHKIESHESCAYICVESLRS